MIRTIPNPETSREDVIRFREMMRKCVKGEFTVIEKAQIQDRKQEMKRVEKLFDVTMEERTLFSDIDFSINLLSDHDDLSPFSCGCEELDFFFHKEVNLCVKYKYVST